MATDPHYGQFSSPKRGNQIGDLPMGVAERKRRSREKLRAQGSKEFLVRMSGKKLELLDQLVESGMHSRGEALSELIDAGLLLLALQGAIEGRRPDKECLAELKQDKLFTAVKNTDWSKTLKLIDGLTKATMK